MNIRTLRITSLCLPLVWISALSQPLLAADEVAPAARTAAYQGSITQQQLLAQTARVKEELLRLLDEFAGNNAASAELTQARETIEKLTTLSEVEMRAVVELLRAASKAETARDATDKRLSASGTQKEIQSELRKLVDLLELKKDEASMEQRIKDLVQRQMKNMGRSSNIIDGTTRDWERKDALAVTAGEQDALKAEFTLLMEKLQKLASAGLETSGMFAQVAQAGQNAQLQPLSVQASADLVMDERIQPDMLKPALETQGKIVAALQSMLDVIHAAKSDAERAREVAKKLAELTSREEQLAKSTERAGGDNLQGTKAQQREIANELAATGREAARLNPEAAKQMETAWNTMKDIDEKLKKGALWEPEARAAMVDEQLKAAEELEKAAELMDKQADEMEGAGEMAGAGEMPEGSLSPEAEAIMNAANSVMESQQDMNSADGSMRSDGETQSIGDKLASAKDMLGKAQGEVAKAGDAAPQSAMDHIESAENSLGRAEAFLGIGPEAGKDGQGTDKQRAQFALDDAQRSAEKALNDLRQAANDLATGKGMATGAGKAGGFDGTAGMGGGGPGNTQATPAEVNALASVSPEGRDALTQLQKEKYPAEYSPMVEQYLKNLAEGELPCVSGTGQP